LNQRLCGNDCEPHTLAGKSWLDRERVAGAAPRHAALAYVSRLIDLAITNDFHPFMYALIQTRVLALFHFILHVMSLGYDILGSRSVLYFRYRIS
jgi:hypothetical protein